jgi:cytoskeletal protein CcmA (bactofilin family)
LEDARVGGTLAASGDLSFAGIDVGGRVMMGSGKGESITVGGVLEVKGDLDLEDDLNVGGRAKIDGDLKADDISVGGEMQASSAIAQGKLDIGGNLTTSRGARAQEIQLGKRARARGPLVGEVVKIRAKAETEDIHAEDLWLGDDCSVKNVYFRRGEISKGCVVSGKVQYTEEVRLGRDVRLASQPEKVTGLPTPPI